MVQTAKAQQNQAVQQNQDQQNESVVLTEETLQKILTPMAEAIAQLKTDKAAEATASAEAQEAARQAQLNKDVDISGMLKDVDAGGTGDDVFEQMSKRQLVDILSGAMETALEANATKIKSDISQSLTPGTERVDAMEKAVYAILGKLGADDSRSKHDDFDEYAEGISKIMGDTPGITYERAYLIAKGEAAGKLPPKGQIDSEKPTDSSWSPGAAQGGTLPNQGTLQQIADRGSESREESSRTTSGTVGIRNIINDGVNKAVDALFSTQR